MKRDKLRKALTHATSLVLSVKGNNSSMSEFIKAYGNFYYSYALDGHESDLEEHKLLDELQWAIEFHRKVQEEVLNHVHLHDDMDTTALNRLERIDLMQAKGRLDELCRKHGAEEIFRKLAE